MMPADLVERQSMMHAMLLFLEACVKARLNSIPGVRIEQEWTHDDLTLEDFGFTISVRLSRPTTV